MTEAEWLTTTEPKPLLTFLWSRASERQLRLFTCACCRSVWHKLRTKRSRRSVEVAERFADGQATAKQLSRAWSAGGCLEEWLAGESARQQLNYWQVSGFTCEYPERTFGSTASLRDIFGNPFRPVSVDPSWLNSSVLALARQMYESRDFSPMPILADALQDADCVNDDILNHCRGESVHVRGCWVLDLLLAKD